MVPQEIERIVKRGFDLLRIPVERPAMDLVVELSAGYPYGAHLLGLHASRIVKEQSEVAITAEVMHEALDHALIEFGATFDEKYQMAIERSGTSRARHSLLHALAEVDRESFQFQDAVSAFRGKFGSAPGTLNVSIGLLCKSEKGALLKRLGDHQPYTYKFANPLIRSYLRMKVAGGALLWRAKSLLAERVDVLFARLELLVSGSPVLTITGARVPNVTESRARE